MAFICGIWVEQAGGDACVWQKKTQADWDKNEGWCRGYSVWDMITVIIIAGVNRHVDDVLSMKDSLLFFQAFICCDCLLEICSMNIMSLQPLQLGDRTSGATRDSAMVIIPTGCMSMFDRDLSFFPTALIISHHLQKMHQTFAFWNPPLLS